MSEWRQHSNPWAEKLSQVSLPDGGDSWKAMEAVLDREMPTSRRRDWRRWFLLVLQLSGEEEVLGHYNEISRAYPIARRPFGGDTGPCHFHGDTGPCNPSAGGSVQAGRRVNAGS